MARIILGSYMIRYPLGGMMSWVLQYLVGLDRLGHDVYFVEKAGYENACFDPIRQEMTDDSSYGIQVVSKLLARFGLGDRLCFVDWSGTYYGKSKEEIELLFDSTDFFLDMGTHGGWLEEADKSGKTVLIDGEPGFTQMKRVASIRAGESPPQYDYYFSTGRNIGSEQCSAPSAGEKWGTLFHPVVADLYQATPSAQDASFSTVMNWQSYEPLIFEEQLYGHKDLEFARFLDLPNKVATPIEIAVSGKNVPTTELREAGWQLRDAHEVTISYDSFIQYVGKSAGEFSVCKNGFVATRSGWFSDRSAVYLAHGKPVVMQDTGFSEHLPCGQGLFAVNSVEQAAAAIDEVARNPEEHSRAAVDIARSYLDTNVVLSTFLESLICV